MELFDPHEPFHAPKRFRRKGDSTWEGGVLNWPDYVPVNETEEEIAEIRACYASQIRMLDEYVGRLLDIMDQEEMWDNTAIIMSTDHGFLLGEHGWWGKSRMPYYEEMSHIPLMICHPGYKNSAGRRSQALTQTIDLMPTILDIFGIKAGKHVTGQSLLSLMNADTASFEDRIVAFGLFAGPIGVTDGRYVMLHYPPDVLGEGLFEYTLMPQHMVRPFAPKELATAKLVKPFGFTDGIPLLRMDARRDAARPPNLGGSFMEQGFRLYDLKSDPEQRTPIRNQAVEARLYQGLRDYMETHEAPGEAYVWHGL
ncbi:sulfatase [Rhizobium sp. L1K21]|uniref:sulfatase family protein n=1 Tax=Rhizobium sp. L1K21 TaxID=2954933 RepID=UPI003593E10A